MKARVYLSRRTVLAIAGLATECFEYYTYSDGFTPRRIVQTDWLADLLFEKEHALPLVETARAHQGTIKDFVLGLYSGRPRDIAVSAAHDVTRELVDFPAFADQLLQRVAADLLEYSSRAQTDTHIRINPQKRDALIGHLELDGLHWDGNRLLRLEENAFDVEEQAGVIEATYQLLGLGNLDQVQQELSLIDEHYLNGKWGDCIKHARDLAECVLLEVLTAQAALGAATIPNKARERAVLVREELKASGVLDEREHAFVSALWKLVSEQGGHVNMSQKENARICRQYVLSAVHFVLLRYQALHPPP